MSNSNTDDIFSLALVICSDIDMATPETMNRLYCKHSHYYIKRMAEFSRLLYQTLDHLGYNHDMIKFRREAWKYWSEIYNKYKYKGENYLIITGSKTEGTTSIFESDIDLITLSHDLICITNTEQLPSHLPDGLIVFLADMENVPPGYTRLKLHHSSPVRIVRYSDIHDCLFEMPSGEVYLSSSLFTAANKNTSTIFTTSPFISGPAITTTGETTYDEVFGFTLHCPVLLQKWASRRRRHEWPSQDIISKACSFLPQVVPVGAKGSDRQFQEWRFCFIESELTLTHSLNETQIKLYILLKMIAKNVLIHVTGEISSYIMKNITYWLSELLPLYVFREEKLVSLVLFALSFLRTAITQWHNLPYYMIPSRNLLSERLDARIQRELSDLLSQLIQEGPRLFLRIKKLRISLAIACRKHSDVVIFGNMRDQVEKCYIACFVLMTLHDIGILADTHDKEASLVLKIRRLACLYKRLIHSSRHACFDGLTILQIVDGFLS